jgi:hypothetical protein
MSNGTHDHIKKARLLMDDFASRTGLTGNDGDISQRYLWTDAFAVQAFFGLSQVLDISDYRDLALKLIDAVHHHLGRFRGDDSRVGWISGLPDEEGKKHPTIGGLRIGKRLPERKSGELYEEPLEWERDGQYFHYLTRWINSLLVAAVETGEQRYAIWAAELTLAGHKFIDKNNGVHRMFWKMNTDLSRPLVKSMGAHDPLEGLICAKSAKLAVPQKAKDLDPLIEDYKILCQESDWFTPDELGVGILLLNAKRAEEIVQLEMTLPESANPARLIHDCDNGLEAIKRSYNPKRPANARIAFRECGLSLGLRIILQDKDRIRSIYPYIDKFEKYLPVADEIEALWLNPENQKTPSWNEHYDINAVTLAASLLAKENVAFY